MILVIFFFFGGFERILGSEVRIWDIGEQSRIWAFDSFDRSFGSHHLLTLITRHVSNLKIDVIERGYCLLSFFLLLFFFLRFFP